MIFQSVRALYTVPYMTLYARKPYVYIHYIVHIASYKTVSVCYNLLNYMREYQHGALFRTLSRSHACTPAFLLPTCNVLIPVYVSTNDSAVSAGSVEAAR